MAVFPVIADANVLFGILPTDFLIRTSGLGLFRLHWSQKILTEARRSILAKLSDIDPGGAGPQVPRDAGRHARGHG